MKLSSQMALQTYGILGPIDIRYTLAQEVALPGVKDKVRFASPSRPHAAISKRWTANLTDWKDIFPLPLI